jgi:hypothetical protein
MGADAVEEADATEDRVLVPAVTPDTPRSGEAGLSVHEISEDATLALPLSVPQRSGPDSRFESSLPSHFALA